MQKHWKVCLRRMAYGNKFSYTVTLKKHQGYPFFNLGQSFRKGIHGVNMNCLTPAFTELSPVQKNH